MILVDIYVPVLDKTYNFRLDETARVEDVTEEIAEVICQREQITLLGSADDLLLSQTSSHHIMAASATLAGSGIGSGDVLTLL